MPNDLELNEPPKRKEIRKQSPSFSRIWANDAQAGHSPWDFRLVLGQLLRGTPELLEVEECVSINMSPQFAKRLVEALQANIDSYEHDFGKIETPRGMPPIRKSESQAEKEPAGS